MNLHLERRHNYIFALVLTLSINGLILGYFHNRFWWPPDEGAYAHTAERVLQGEALNSEVEEIHTGYLNFLHAGAFKLFGLRLVSLRYPLILVAFLQSLLVFFLFARRDLPIACIASIGAVSLGVPQFLNPQPSWYCLFLVTLIALCLTYMRDSRTRRLLLVGFLVGLVFLLRQVTGVFVALGVVTYLLIERTHDGESSNGLIAKGVIGLMAIGTALYLKSATDSYGFLLIGIWPLAVLAQAFLITRTSNRKSLDLIAKLSAGASAAALPIVTYHLWHKSLWTFVDDTVLRAVAVSKFTYLREASYLTAQSYGLRNVIEHGSWTTVINGLYWFALPFLILIVGFAGFLSLRKANAAKSVGAVPVLAVFYALVALLQQIPIYLYYVLPFSLAALFWLTLHHRVWRIILSSAAVIVSLISLYWQAGQPVTRNMGGIVRGDRIPMLPATTLDRAGLKVDSESLLIYTELVDRIKSSSTPSDTIFVLPNNPELYFLSKRKNPFRFWNSAIGIRHEGERDVVLLALQREKPRLVIFVPADRNNSVFSQQIMVHVKQNYRLDDTVAGFEIYSSGQRPILHK